MNDMKMDHLGIAMSIINGRPLTDNEPPKLTGDMIYQNSCKRFGFQVVLKNAEDVQIDVKNVGFGEYEGGSKRMFDVDVYKEGGREDSNKVKTLVVKNIMCS